MLALPSERLGGSPAGLICPSQKQCCLTLHVGSAAGQGLLSASQNPFAPVVLQQTLPGADQQKSSPFPLLPIKTELPVLSCILIPKSWPRGLSSVTPGQTFLPEAPPALPAEEGFFPLAFPQSWPLSLQKSWLSTFRLNF